MVQKSKLVYEELTYRIIGILFKVHNLLGGSLEERYYQRALEKEFKEQEIDVTYEGQKIGKHRLDFIVEGKVIIELKTLPFIGSKETNQLLAYLKSTGVKVGLLVNFRSPKVAYKRVINPLSAKSV